MVAVSRRSPNYPSIDLGAAIDAMRIVFSQQRQTAMPRARLAQHLDHSALNSRALEKIAGVRAYGLVEAIGKEVRVSDDMATILTAPKNTVERQIALTRCAYYPAIYRKIAARYGDGSPDEIVLTEWLAAKGFRPKAIERLTANYLATTRLVADEGGGYHLLAGDTQTLGKSAGGKTEKSSTPITTSVGHRREVITLAEGDVTIIFPSTISIESYEDLAAFFELFLKKTRRRAASKLRD